MQYKLKNREKMAALMELFPNFATALENAYLSSSCSADKKQKRVLRIGSFEYPFWLIELDESEIAEFGDYNPHDWNKYPDVAPPEGVLMRVETKDGKKTCAKYHYYSDGECWCEPDGSGWCQAFSDSVDRFRPWEENVGI